ncbi:MAG: ATPase [Deltaproteobacteria bacterium]|nr:ATPase [Deltaproteobacteria bacterium]MBW2396502.1 ATPase [Deltaproteobacteria bacterium]
MTNRRAKKGPPAAERRDRLIREQEHDPYKVRAKLPDPTACPECGAMYRNGRWMWGAPPADANRELCPACQRIRDQYPAGILTISGPFWRGHKDEILGLARNIEEREKGEHALKRIMAIREEGDAFAITTTDPGLARNIGDALHDAYKGELDYQYTDGENLLRVTWCR